jgi:hypothetical protein
MASVQEFAAKIKAKYPQYQDMPDSVLAERMLAKFPQYKDMVEQAAPTPPEKPGLTLASAAFPGASKERTPQQGIPVMGYGPPREVSPTEQRIVSGMGDALSLPTRAAGTVGGLLGYQGATGGKQGLEALASPETGLLKPVRDASMGLIKNPGMMGAQGIGLGLLGYGAASVAEDPFVIGGALAKPVTSLVSAAGRGLKKTAKAADRFAGKAAEELSGVPEEALRAWGTKQGRAAIQANAGKEYEIGQDLVKMIESFDDYLPEKEAVNRILERMPGISPEKALEALRRSKTATTLAPGKPKQVEVTTQREAPTAANLRPEDGPARNRSFDVLTGDPEIKVKDPGEAGKALADIPTGDAANKKIDDLMGRLKLIAGEDVHTGQMGKIPAKKFRDIRTGYDSEAKAAFKKDDRELIERALVNARNQMAADLRDAAKQSGDPEFVTLMESYSGKLDKLDRIKKFLGSNAETRETRAEGFVANLLNANKTAQQNLLKNLEEVFDANLMTRVQGAKWGKQIGKDGEPALFPRQMTGRSDLGQTIIGTAAFPFSSPAMASRVTLPLFRKLAAARSVGEREFYVKALKKAGATAAEIQAASSVSDALLAPNAIPFRKVAENDKPPQPLARK